MTMAQAHDDDGTTGRGDEPEVAEIAEHDGADWMTRLLQSALFRRMPPANIQALFACMMPVEVSAGEVLVEQGDVGDYYYVIQQGRCLVTQAPKEGAEPIELARLDAGQGFGEEALVSGCERNATVTMASDGVLMRLGKRDFEELIKEPVVTRVDGEWAQAQVAEGAILVDVRAPAEHRQDPIPGSMNIPMDALRLRARGLDPQRSYICCCDTGGRSAAAAFVLIQHGLDACYLGAGPATTPPPAADPAQTERLRDEKALVLARMVKANEELEEVRRMRDAALEQLNQEQLALERRAAETARRLEDAEQLKHEAEAARRSIEERMEDSLRVSREQLEAEGTRAQAALAEVDRLKRETAEARLAADNERRNKQARERELAELKHETERRLHDEEARLRSEWERHQDQLNRLRRAMEAAQSQASEERENLHRRLEAAEDKVRETVGSATTQPASLDAAHAARQAVEEEASRVYARYRKALKAALAEEKTELRAERERLEAEAQRVQKLLDSLQQISESERLAAVKRAAMLHAPMKPTPVESDAPSELELLPGFEVEEGAPPQESGPPAHKRWVEPDEERVRVMSADRVATIRDSTKQ